MSKIIPVVLCGGVGTRLWPLSRAGFPKQFLVLSGFTSLFQQAVERLNSISSNDISVGETLVVTGEEHRFIALDQLRAMPYISAKLLLEPIGKNTAPAVTFAAFQALKQGDDPVLVISPADQIVSNSELFNNVLRRAIKVADTGSIVILGIKPTSPAIGFGYIKQSGVVGKFGDFKVDEFVEKPCQEVAEAFFENESYSWNGGIFVVRASVWINALREFRKDILVSTEIAFNNSYVDKHFIRPAQHFFDLIPSDSVDYAVLEKCPGSQFDIRVIPLDAGWNDLGGWHAVWQASDKDPNGNLIRGDVLVEASKNNLIYSSNRLVATVGVANLVIVETADAVMVADRSQSEQVKKIVTQLSNQSRDEHVLHRKVSRPWGWYDTIDAGDRFKVKRIQVNPGASLSLQTHAKRAEHWIVVRGVAEVTCGANVMILKENESTFIPLGEKHRLSNPSSEVLEIIEVQSGSYLGEDDIVRIDDGYGRN